MRPLSLFAFLLLFTSGYAQENAAWKQFLFRPNANYNAICAEADRYFEAHKPEIGSNQEEEPEDSPEDEGSEYNQYQRWKWFWSTRVNEDGSFPDIRPLGRMREKRSNAGRVADRSGGDDNCGWRLISQNTCTGGYHGMGRTTCIAFHPTDPNIYFVGSPNGGIWKTTDGGDTYAPVSEGLPYNGASNLLIDDQNPDVMYLSNGDHSGWWTFSTGIWKSVDGGASWFPTSLSWSLSQNVAVLSTAMNPEDPSVLLVAASNGLWRSADAGTNWTKVRDGFYSDVKFRPGDGSTVYAALHDYWGVSQVYKSEDGGLNWSKISSFTASHNWIRLAVTPANPDLLAVAGSYDDKRPFYLSTDKGVTLNYRSECPDAAFLAASPNDPATLYCGYVDVYRSKDLGNTWQKATNWFGGQPEPEVHADEHFAAAQPGTGRMFFCNDGGLYRYDETTNTWTERSNGLIITQFYHIAVAQTDETFMIGGTQDNGGRKRVGQGEWEPTNGGDAMEVAIDYTDPKILYTTYINGQLYRSLDGWVNDVNYRISNFLPGQTANHDLSGSWVAPYQIDPVNPKALVLGYADVYRTTNRGLFWTKISNNLTGNPDEKLDALTIAPSNPDIIYASNNNVLYKTTNLGGNWTNTIPPGGAPITSITAHPQNPNIVYITRGGYSNGSKVYRSDNGGTAWVNISGSLPNVPANCLYFDLAADSSYTLFVGNDLGVYYRTSTMSDWREMNQNLPVTIVTDLELQRSARQLRAGTYGRGIWEYDLDHLPAKDFAACTGESRATICLPNTWSTTISANAWQNLGGPVNLTLGPLPAGIKASLSASTIEPGADAGIDFELPAGLPEGEYPVTILATANGDTARATVRLTLVSSDFSALALSTPVNGAAGVPLWPVLHWNKVADANQYELELATNPSFEPATIVKSYLNLKTDSLQWAAALGEGQVYYWRIRPVNECGPGSWTEPFVFATAAKTCTAKVANDLPKPISANGTPTVESKITIDAGFPISEIRIKNFEGNHQFFKDLDARLIGPSGTEAVLFANKCGSYSGGFRLGFDDYAPTAFGCPPPQDGNGYRPEGLLSVFNGQDAAGQWTLRVKDGTISSGGQLLGFALEFCSTTALHPPVIVHNELLEIEPGHNAVIDTLLLKAEDGDTPDEQIIFTLLTTPQHGELQRNWAGAIKAGDQFSQADLNNGSIRYFDYGTPNQGDSFRFSATDGDGGLAAGVFNIRQFPTSTNEPGKGLSFNITPNPASETLRLSFNEALNSDAQVHIFSATGQLVRQTGVPTGATMLNMDINGLPAGVYSVVVRNGTEAGVKQVVVLW